MKVLAKGKIGPAPFSFRRAVNGGGIERECARITSQAAASAAAAAITLSPFWGIESDGGNPTAKSRSAVGRRRTAPSASSLATRESLRRGPWRTLTHSLPLHLCFTRMDGMRRGEKEEIL